MAKDKRIADLPGISQAAIVALSRIGLLTATDLVNADFDRIAVVLEDFNEADRLVREARKTADLRKGKEAPTTPGPLSSVSVPTPRTAVRVGTSGAGSRNQKNQSAASASVVGNALTLAATSMHEGADWRATLLRRMESARFILEYDGSANEVAAVLLLEAAESEALGDEARLGPELDSLLEECISLRAVPTLPSGRPPRYYLEMAAKASLAARRVCAADLLSGGMAESDRLPLLIEALLEGEGDELVARLTETPDGRRKAA